MNDNTPVSIESISQVIGLAPADVGATVRNIVQLVLPILFLITLVLIVVAIVRIRQAVKAQDKARESKWRWWLVVFVALVPLLALAWAMVVFRAESLPNVTAS